MTTDNQYGWAAFVARCKAQKDDVPVIGTLLLISDVLEVEQARSDAARLAALVLEYVTPDGIRPTAPREKLADMVSLARALIGELAQDDAPSLLTNGIYPATDAMPTAPGVYEDTGADPVHPHFTPQAEQRRDGGG